MSCMKAYILPKQQKKKVFLSSSLKTMLSNPFSVVLLWYKLQVAAAKY